MDCSIEYRNPKAEAFKAIKAEVGTNETLFTEYFTEVVGGMDGDQNYLPTKEFKEWFESKGYKIPLDFNTNKGRMKEIIKTYYRHNHPDGSKTVMDNSQNEIVAAFGYDSVVSRNEGKAMSVGLLNNIYRTRKYIMKDEPTTGRKDFYRNELKSYLEEVIAKRAANGNEDRIDEILDGIDEGTVNIYELLDDSNVQNANLLALYQELTSDNIDENGKPHGENFAEELFTRSDINFRDRETFGENNEITDEGEKASDDDEADQETSGLIEQDFDTTIATYDHSGQVVNVMLHLGDKIKSYFNSLKRMDKDGNLDTDNAFGIPYYMNANECATMMYHNADFTNKAEMINSVRRIADQYPSFSAFRQFADDMEKNPHFAYSVYSTFGKIIISKLEVTLTNGILEAKISNTKANKKDALTYEFQNIVKSSVTINDHSVMSNRAAEIEKDLESTGLDKVKFAGVKANLVKLIRAYYPTVQESAINSFISNTVNSKGKIVEKANVRLLLDSIKKTIEEAKNSIPLTEKKNRDYEVAIAKNRVERRKARFAHRQPNLINTNAILAKDAVTDALKNEAKNLAEKLLPYSDVKIELNSTNALGNQSSDVVNNSMVSYIQNLMNNSNNIRDEKGNFLATSPIVQFGKDKFGLNNERTQYKFSNILVEQTDKDGNVINWGMFKLDNGKYVPTEYATEILNAFLFNGATNFDNNDSRVYSQMDEIDYTITAFAAYQNSVRGAEHNKAMQLTNFFMRTPSDAPKNYIITMPRYDITGLIKSDGTIDHNHPIFKQFAMIFRQELLNACVARDVVFDCFSKDIENADGTVTTAGTVKSINGKASMDKRELFKIYHAEVDKNGNYVLTKVSKNKLNEGQIIPSGKAFTSDRFVVGGKNFGQDFIDAYVDFFYGAADHIDVNKRLAVKTDNQGNIIDIDLNQQQRAAMVEMIDNFIKEVSSIAQTRIAKSVAKLDNKPTKSDIDEFALNYRLAYTNFADLFEGDSKFYKGSQDFLKRAKEAQGSGVPYGLMDYLNVFDFSPRTEIARVKILDGELDFPVYNKFRGITIQNSIMTTEAMKPIDLKTKQGGTVARKLASIFHRQNPNLTFEECAEKANNIVSGYANTKVNDAQSYITVEEWARRIIGRGQYEQYSELIDKILSGEKLNGEDILAINQYVQVQKNFYYDLHYNDRVKVNAPRQIKNAEFVLVPQLIEGTELERVYDLMRDLDIDQLNTEETSKAGKARVLRLWDNTGNLNEEYVEDFVARAKDYVELYDYNHLYTQQETPQHINANNKAAIQIMKKIVDNIDKDSKLYPHKEKFMNLYSELVKDSNTQLMEELEVKLTSNGEIESINYDKLYEMFREEAERLGIDSNLIDYLTLDPVTKLPLMPNTLNLTANRIENVAQALINSRVTRQTLPGFHAAQVTNVGFKQAVKDINETFDNMSNKELLKNKEFIKYCEVKGIDIKELAKKTSKISDVKPEFKNYIQAKRTHIITSGDLKYHEDKDGKFVPYIEVMLPKANFGLQDYSDEEALRMLQQCVDENGVSADTIIGYRIPTEGKQSVAIMKVVGFTADEYGSTIVVPNDWVAQTGSDFDIDSIYGIQRNINLVKSDEFGQRSDDLSMKLEFEKSNARKIKQNNLISEMITILSADESMEEHFGRSNFDYIESELNWLKDPKNGIKIDIAAPKNPYDFFDQADYQNEVMSNARLKGLSVVRDTFCSICNTIKPTLNGYTVKIAYPKNKRSYSELINRFEEVKEDGDNYIVTHRMFGWSNDNKNIDGRILTSYSSETTAHILDAVKAGMVPNVNDDTFMIYKTIIDLGSNYETAIRWMALPGVKYIADAINSNNSIYSSYGGKPIKQAIKTWAASCGFKLEKNGRPISFNKLMEQINNAGIDLQYDDATDTFTGDASIIEPIDATVATQRLKGKKLSISRPVEKVEGEKEGETETVVIAAVLSDEHWFDLQTILQYHNLSKIAEAVNDMTRCSNPDKFGAKQSVYETYTVIADIGKALYKKTADVLIAPNGKSLLESIYPGVKEAISTNNDGDTLEIDFGKLMKEDRSSESTYKTLYSFLRYATIPSIVINSNVFNDTQREEFRNAILELQKSFTNDKVNMNNKTYKDIEKYILGYHYNQINFVKTPITLDKNKGFWKVPKDKCLEDGTPKWSDELSRIKAANRTPNTSFTVVDINDPKQEEIDKFAELTPAEKVRWIQQHYRNGLICKYLNTNLSNPNRKGAQTIEFVENNDDIENVYQAFNDTYYNSDPFLRMTAADIIKYAFVVEGYKMAKNAVNKTIQNKALMDMSTDDSNNKYGTSIASELQTLLNVGAFIQDEDIKDEILTNYVRSAKPKELKPIQLKDNTDLVVTNIEGQSILKWVGATEPKTFICVRDGFGQNSKNIYYKFYNGYYLPLNPLERNENSEWSSVDSNNIYFNELYYKDLIDGKISKEDDLARYKAPTTNSSTGRVKLDLYSPVTNQHRNESEAFKIIRNDINKWFTTQDQKDKYLWAPVFKHYFKKVGDNAIIDVEDKVYKIEKINPERIYKLVNSSLPVEEMDESPAIKDIVTKLREVGVKNYVSGESSDIYAVSPIEEEWSASGLQENTSSNMASRTFKSFENQASLDIKSAAAEAVESGNKEGISSDEESIKANMEKAFGIIAETLSKESDNIIDNLKRFIKDEATGNVYSITSPEAINLIRKDENERRRFLKAILDARAFTKRYEMFNSLNLDSEDPKIRQYLESIQESINKLQDPIIQKAEIIFGKEYLDNISNDPLIKKHILSVLDGYTSTGTIESWINDMQETTNPLIQLITKEVMANIREKEFIAKDAAVKFRKELKRRFKEAAEKGTPIEWSRIIDESGTWVKNYNEKFEADYNNKVNELVVARKLMDSITNKDSEEYNKAVGRYLDAKLDLEKWKLAHVNQRFIDSYYKEMNDLTENALKFNRDTFIEYTKLEQEKKRIRSHINKGNLDDALKDELKDVNRKISNLTKEYEFDGEAFIEKSEEDKRKARLLKQYIDGRNKVYEKYFDDEENIGFRNELNKNLDIVEDYEEKGERSTYTKDDYKKAQEWLSTNARFEVKDDITNAVNRAYKILYESKRGEEANPEYRKAIENHNSRDRFGVIDATDFTDEEINKIKEEEEGNARRRVNGGYNDKILIKNEDPNNDKIYKQDFYSKMKMDGADNAAYFKVVSQINEILSNVYKDKLKEVRTSELSEEDLKKLKVLYDSLGKMKKHLGVSEESSEAAIDFISKEVDFGINEARFNEEYEEAKRKGDDYARDWYLANTEPERNKYGQVIAGGKRVPNHFLYGTIKAKNEAKWLDQAKMDAIATLKKYVDRHPTQYWYNKKKEMRRKVTNGEITQAEYDTWYDANIIYDPQTQTIVPIKCWMQNDIKTSTPGSWEAAFNQKHNKPKKEYVNKDYVNNATVAQNYKVGTGYDNEKATMNAAEVDLRNWLQTYLLSMARTADSQRFLNKGYIPARAKEGVHDAWFWAKEAGKWIGVVEGANGRETFDQDSDVSYEQDFATPMPMTYLLQEKDIEIKDNPAPIRREDESLEDYENRIKEWQKEKDENEKARRESHKNIIDNNWEDSIAEFIEKAGHYNAVQDNKNLMFYGLNMIKKIETIQPNLGFSKLHKSSRRSTKGKTVYEEGVDTNLVNQYVNWMRRLIYNQYRRPNKNWTKIASIMQSITSSNFMMLNVRGGIANVTYGETQIWAEAFAGEYFNFSIMQDATNEYMGSIVSMMANMYNSTSTSKVDAVLKAMNVVDFDALVEAGRTEYTFADWEQKLRDAMYSPQTMGEHFMQNRALIAMMMSHRLVKNNNKELNGKGDYVLLNEKEYIRDMHEQALKEVLDDAMWQKYLDYQKRLLSDENTAKEVMWRRKDMTYEFASRYLKGTPLQEAFVKKKKELEKRAKDEFNDDDKHPTLWSQVTLDTETGIMGFAKDSILEGLNVINPDGTNYAFSILGAFKGRVISVNKKIHGVYDKLGSAQFEKFWYGPLVMQYHKHIFPGLMKRWRRQGGFNEERGTVEKGSYIALWDFLCTPIRQIKDKAGLTDAEVEAMCGIQNVLKSIAEFLANINVYWNMLPDSEKANIRRNLGDVCGVLSALFVAIGVRCMMDDDDDSIMLNLALYEADRLSSEAWQYNPWGAASEFKKLWSSPVAVQSIVGDVFNSAGTLAQMLIEGDEYDPYYHSGKYAKQHKLKVYIERRIPIYRGVKSVLNIADDNHYYKLGDNMLSIIPVADIATNIKEAVR